MNGIICINKPSGWTSFDVVAKARGIAQTRKAGHSGTLDPMATGVLPLFFGNSTRACDIMPNDDKGYIAEFKFGITTDTLDITGEVKTQVESHVTLEQLQNVIPKYMGNIEQIPPMFSAIQVNGRRLYDIARSGQEVERKPRPVEIKKLVILDFNESEQTAKLEVICSKGTYIRTLCDDIGKDLVCGATLKSLVRHIAGVFKLEDCITLEQMQELASKNELEQKAIPVAKIFEQLPKIKLNSIQSSKFMNGVKLDLNRVHHKKVDGLHKVFNQDNIFMGLANVDFEEMELVIAKMFATKQELGLK